MTLGSLFDGIGGFPLAAQRCGIEPVWASEIEAAPISITKKHFPNMRHLGSVTDINGAEIEPVDIISFGSPCQDLSVAGKQAGLNGERSGLFMEAVRIIKEMRLKTNGVYPAYAIWENVPGAFSSHKGEDFRRVLEEIAESEIPMPRSGKWAESGMVRVSDREISWRTLDAQYWGVPQRRKRIYLVCHFGTERTEEILFKCESLLGYTPQGGEERKEAAAAVGGCAESAGFIDRASAEAGSVGYQEEISPTLRAGLLPSVITSAGFNGQNSITAANVDFLPECAPCIRSKVTPNCLQGVYEMSHANEGLRKTEGDVCPTLQARMGTGGNQIPLVVDTPTYCIHDRQAVIYTLNSKQISLNAAEGLASTLAANDFKEPQSVVYAIDRAAFNQGENAKYDFEVSDKGIASTLVARGPSAVCYDIGEEWRRTPSEYAELSPTITARCGTGGNNTPAVVHKIAQFFRWIVRRLTPRECERLQGFPDDWTRYGADGKEIKDAPRYKALGNSIAIPCADRVFKGILSEEARHDSRDGNI